jgi:hypothetical protein
MARHLVFKYLKDIHDFTPIFGRNQEKPFFSDRATFFGRSPD